MRLRCSFFRAASNEASWPASPVGAARFARRLRCRRFRRLAWPPACTPRLRVPGETDEPADSIPSAQPDPYSAASEARRGAVRPPRRTGRSRPGPRRAAAPPSRATSSSYASGLPGRGQRRGQHRLPAAVAEHVLRGRPDHAGALRRRATSGQARGPPPPAGRRACSLTRSAAAASSSATAPCGDQQLVAVRVLPAGVVVERPRPRPRRSPGRSDRPARRARRCRRRSPRRRTGAPAEPATGASAPASGSAGSTQDRPGCRRWSCRRRPRRGSARAGSGRSGSRRAGRRSRTDSSSTTASRSAAGASAPRPC